MRLGKVSFVSVVIVVLAMTHFAPLFVESKLVDETWFDVGVTLEFQSGEILEPDSGFEIETNDDYLLIEIWIDTVQYPAGEIHLILLRVNGDTLLREAGIVRVDLDDYDNFLEIKAYGEGFVKYTDSAYEDLVEGTVNRQTRLEISPYLLFLIIGLIAGLIVYKGPGVVASVRSRLR